MSITRARVSVTGTFFLNGAVFSSWYARLPAIQERLELSPGALGIALFGAPVGLLVAQPTIGALAARTGSRPIVAAAPLYLGAVVLPGLAVDTMTLLLAVTLVGAANGILDIAMNAQGLAVVGAVLAGALVPGLLRDRGDPDAPRFARPSRRLAVLGVIAFCALLAEGAVFDWSGVYLSTQAGARAGLAPLGLAAFALLMGVGRLAGDRVAARAGSARTARAGALLAALGLGVALAVAAPVASIVGFALMGLGLSAVFPLTLRASGLGGHAAAPSLAAVSTVGYGGFLAGPPVIGLLAELTDLRAALALVCLLCAVAAALAAYIGRAEA